MRNIQRWHRIKRFFSNPSVQTNFVLLYFRTNNRFVDPFSFKLLICCQSTNLSYLSIRVRSTYGPLIYWMVTRFGVGLWDRYLELFNFIWPQRYFGLLSLTNLSAMPWQGTLLPWITRIELLPAVIFHLVSYRWLAKFQITLYLL